MPIDKELRIKYILDQSQFTPAVNAANASLQQTGQHLNAGTQSAMDMTKAMLGVVGVQSGLGAVGQIIGSMSQGMKDAADYTKHIAEDFIRTRDTMRELAGILGQKGDINFAQQQYGFAARTGMDVGESTKYREAFQGVAQQYKGKFANEAEFNKYEEQSARYAATMGLSPDVAADLAGAMIRTMPKGGTAQDAMLAFGQSFHTMQQGSGSNKVLASQLREVTSSLVGPGMAFSSPQEAAVAVRTMAESNPEEASTMLQRMRDGQLKLDDKEKAELGVDAKTPMLEMIRRVGAKAKEAQAKTGVSLDEYLMKYFPLAISRRGFQVGIQQGLGNNVLQKGLDDVNDIGAGETESGVDDAFADPSQPMMLRQAEAGRKAEEAKLGHDKALIAPYLERAKAGMAGRNASPLVAGLRNLGDMITTRVGWLGGSSLNSQQTEEYQSAAGSLNQQAKDAGLNVPRIGDAEITGDTRALERHMAQMVELLRQANDQRGRQAPAVPPAMNGKPTVAPQAPR